MKDIIADDDETQHGCDHEAMKTKSKENSTGSDTAAYEKPERGTNNDAESFFIDSIVDHKVSSSIPYRF